MKKTCALRILSVLLAFLLLPLYCFSHYSDAEYSEYINLEQGSSIPSLFRNDAVFTEGRDTPLVIHNGTEYIPLPLFMGLPGVVVNFSFEGSNFYIQNKNKNKYISFNIPNKYAITGQNKVYQTEVKSFYDTHYVPLRIVCEATGIMCDTYNDTENKLYVVKVYTAEGISASELIRVHAPSIYQKPQDPPDDIGQRSIYVSVVGGGLEQYSGLCATLTSHGMKGAFFLTREDIVSHPDLVRRIFVDGHTIGITFTKSAAELSEPGVLEEECKATLDALYKAIKTKTRLVVLPPDAQKSYEKNDVAGRLSSLGLKARSFTIDARTDVLSGVSALAAVNTGIRNYKGTGAVHIRLAFSASSQTVIRGLYTLGQEHKELSFRQLTEATE